MNTDWFEDGGVQYVIDFHVNWTLFAIISRNSIVWHHDESAETLFSNLTSPEKIAEMLENRPISPDLLSIFQKRLAAGRASIEVDLSECLLQGIQILNLHRMKQVTHLKLGAAIISPIPIITISRSLADSLRVLDLSKCINLVRNSFELYSLKTSYPKLDRLIVSPNLLSDDDIFFLQNEGINVTVTRPEVSDFFGAVEQISNGALPQFAFLHLTVRDRQLIEQQIAVNNRPNPTVQKVAYVISIPAVLMRNILTFTAIRQMLIEVGIPKDYYLPEILPTIFLLAGASSIPSILDESVRSLINVYENRHQIIDGAINALITLGDFIQNNPELVVSICLNALMLFTCTQLFSSNETSVDNSDNNLGFSSPF